MSFITRTAVFALLALLAAGPGKAAETSSNVPATLDRIMTALRSTRHVQARYIEHRYLHALRTPIETRGALHFDAPDHLEKASDPDSRGSAERLTIDGDRLTIDRGGNAPPIVLSLHEHPEIGVLVDSIRMTLSGDEAALRQNFDVTASGTVGEWQLALQPRGNQTLLQWMRISGFGARITAIDSQDTEGDRSDMSIVEQSR